MRLRRSLDLRGTENLRLHAWVSGGEPDAQLDASPQSSCAATGEPESATPPEARTVLLLHGFGDHSRIWDPVLPAIPEAMRTVALDLRGHGDSDWSPSADYTRRSFAADLDHAIPSLLSTQPVVLIGHSLGGSLAVEYAAKHPRAVAALAILDVGPRVSRSAMQRLTRSFREEPQSFPDQRSYARHLRRRYWLARQPALEAFGAHGARTHEDGAVTTKLDPTAYGMLGDRTPGRDMWSELAEIACPTLVLRARMSAVLSRDVARRMAEEVLARGELSEIPGAGHALLLDNPEAVREALADFLGRLDLPRL